MNLRQQKRSLLLYAAFSGCLLLSVSDSVSAQQTVFTAGESGYASFRIPAIVQATNGDLLAICEGRDMPVILAILILL